jgi:hypothetical protein
LQRDYFMSSSGGDQQITANFSYPASCSLIAPAGPGWVWSRRLMINPPGRWKTAEPPAMWVTAKKDRI